jgi:CRISPR/Cas system-associated exonuclease Cas4 (RecB family)
MNIISKFNYEPLNRVDHPSGRRYTVGEGRPLPSVTTILSKTKDMTFLKEWRANVGEAEATRITTEAAGIGSSMHSNLEKYILGKEMSGNLISQILASVIIKQGLVNVTEVWGIEVGLYSKELYAGTTDLVGLHNGTPAIMDFKNSRAAKKKEWIEDYFMQLAAYSLSHNEMFGTNINKGVIMLATRDAKYQEFIIEGDEFTHYETMWANKVHSYYDQYGIS